MSIFRDLRLTQNGTNSGVGPILGEALQDIGDFANFARVVGPSTDDGKTVVHFFSRTKLTMVTPLLTATHLQGKIWAFSRLADTTALLMRKFQLHWTVIV